MTRISIPVDSAMKTALITLAVKELRDPRDQATMLIRNELVRQGGLPQVQPTKPETLAEAVAKVYEP